MRRLVLVLLLGCQRDEPAGGPSVDCSTVRAKIRASYGAQAQTFQRDPRMSAWFDTTMRVVQEACEQDRWPDALKQCIAAADPANPAAIPGCQQSMPAALHQKLQDRMTAAMQASVP